jgi:hypothetical protein
MMKETLKVINQMVKRGVIEKYGIGGAIAAIYYLEPFETSALMFSSKSISKAVL